MSRRGVASGKSGPKLSPMPLVAQLGLSVAFVAEKARIESIEWDQPIPYVLTEEGERRR